MRYKISSSIVDWPEYIQLQKEKDLLLEYIDFMENKFLDEGRVIQSEYESYKDISRSIEELN